MQHKQACKDQFILSNSITAVTLTKHNYIIIPLKEEVQYIWSWHQKTVAQKRFMSTTYTQIANSG